MFKYPPAPLAYQVNSKGGPEKPESLSPTLVRGPSCHSGEHAGELSFIRVQAGKIPEKARTGQRERREASCVGWESWERFDHVQPSTDRPTLNRGPRCGATTHTLYGNRGSDVSVILKETFDLRKSEGENEAPGGDQGLGRLVSKDLHGGVRLGRHPTPTWRNSSSPSPVRERLGPARLSSTSPSASWGPAKLLLFKELPENRSQILMVHEALKSLIPLILDFYS